jgi:hypothetical protein
MENTTLLQDNTKLKEENDKLKIEIEELTNKLKTYTNTESHRKYYEKNKEKVIDNATKYLKSLKETNPEKLTEYRKRAYQKLKLKKQNLEIK